MQDNPNTSENPPLDIEDWQIAFEPYAGNHGAAIMMGFNLMVLQSFLTIEPLKIDEASGAIDRAMEVLYPYTEFHDRSYDLFIRLAQGKLTMEEERILRALGVKF